MHFKYLILGGGPSGLTIANRLSQRGENSFLVIEKEKNAGGLCRTVEVDGAPIDIGGGHFLDARNREVLDYLFSFMPKEEWNVFQRNSQIRIGEECINHPFEANIWQMSQEKQVQYLKSIAIAGCNIGTPMPEKFVDWIRWKLGDLIAENYMIPYNSKMFGDDLNQLGTYWLEKLPSVSFEETLLSCLNRRMYGKQPAHAQFYYPRKTGYGELWSRMADAVSSHILYNGVVEKFDFEQRSVYLQDGSKISGDYIITTIPWTSIDEFKGLPDELQDMLEKLKYTSVNITYIAEEIVTDAHWIYCPDLAYDYHRILVRSNFCNNAKGYWTETNQNRYHDGDNINFYNEYAYPLNTIDKNDIMCKLLSWARERHVIGLGRWGEWQHYNSDVVVEKALQSANRL